MQNNKLFTADYQKCSWYIKDVLGVKLFPFQELILKAFCDGLEVRVARGCGRSFVAQCFGKYIAHNREINGFKRPNCTIEDMPEEEYANFIASIYDKNDFSKEPDVIFPYTCAIHTDKGKLITEEHISLSKELLSDKEFISEYLCIRYNQC